METSPKINSSADKTYAIKESCSLKKLTTKWDKCLDDYKNYLKEYIKHYKKSLKGNLISLSKYPYLKAKSEALSEQLTGAQNEGLLTEKQIQRITKIQIKTLYTSCT
ncbi:hypothetical protein [Flavobacterium franklandianum]|uniref:Uncharacterized protein n=1 Tax=Flavobacterium franklandianum TaxID=2594430 RepID=A0A553C5Z2_9FLAO|nr:hypothetical protein [Flavobacterium franklandianum]TRX15925.1 hypothetical protein FNW17_15690 [Flavobacterium franklandianum]